MHFFVGPRITDCTASPTLLATNSKYSVFIFPIRGSVSSKVGAVCACEATSNNSSLKISPSHRLSIACLNAVPIRKQSSDIIAIFVDAVLMNIMFASNWSTILSKQDKPDLAQYIELPTLDSGVMLTVAPATSHKNGCMSVFFTVFSNSNSSSDPKTSRGRRATSSSADEKLSLDRLPFSNATNDCLAAFETIPFHLRMIVLLGPRS